MKTEEEIQQLFEQVKHLIESDEPIDNPYEVQPHSFSEAERSSLLDVFPDNVTDDMADKFLQHLALAIGTFHRLNNPKEQPLANLKARKNLKRLLPMKPPKRKKLPKRKWKPLKVKNRKQRVKKTRKAKRLRNSK